MPTPNIKKPSATHVFPQPQSLQQSSSSPHPHTSFPNYKAQPKKQVALSYTNLSPSTYPNTTIKQPQPHTSFPNNKDQPNPQETLYPTYLFPTAKNNLTIKHPSATHIFSQLQSPTQPSHSPQPHTSFSQLQSPPLTIKWAGIRRQQNSGYKRIKNQMVGTKTPLSQMWAEKQ